MNTEIAEYIKNHIREYLPPEYQEAHITLEEVTKGNDRRLTGLMIRNDGEITVPTIYLEPYAKQLAQGRPMDEIIREIVQIRTEQDTRVPFEVSDLMDYRQVKPMLAIRLCDPEQNREYLKDKPFTPCGELAAVYRIQVMESKEGVASAVVTDRMMELWGVTKEQLHQDAVAAETERSPVCFYSMEDMMDEIMFSSKPENLFECTEPLDAATMPMYVLTNASKVNGSGILARDGVLDKIGELLGKNFYCISGVAGAVLYCRSVGRACMAGDRVSDKPLRSANGGGLAGRDDRRRKPRTQRFCIWINLWAGHFRCPALFFTIRGCLTRQLFLFGGIT